VQGAYQTHTGMDNVLPSHFRLSILPSVWQPDPELRASVHKQIMTPQICVFVKTSSAVQSVRLLFRLFVI